MILFLALASAAPEVAVAIPATDAARRLGSHLSAELDEPISIRTSTLTVADVLAFRATDWSERWVVFADPNEGRIIVLRPSDRTVLMRGLDPGTDPHAMAVAAAELLRLARSIERPPPVAVTSALELGFSIALGATIVEAFGHEPLSIHPSLQIGAELIDASGLWSTALLSLRVPHVHEMQFDDTIIRYLRWEPGVMIGAGVRSGDFTFGGTLEVGASITRIEARTGEQIRREDRLPFYLMGGGLVRYHFGAGFGIQLEAALGGSTSPADYLVRDEIALSEGAIRWQAAVLGVWGYR